MAGASHVSPVAPGDTLAGRYRVERIIGIGGMGVVVAARHLELDHLVAIKFLLPKVAENKDIVGRFTREARAAVKIQNDHVARVTDVGTLETGSPYMVMEYLDGSDLEDFVRASGPFSVQDSTDFVLQASEAIAEAHGLGIVHRDLKPGNLFLVRRPDGSRIVKVLDFGISKVTGSFGANAVAPTTTMLGSPPYMSPEQLTTPGEVDARTDIWALGVILYRLLTGRVPFDADTIGQLCTVILHGDPPPLREARRDVPPGLEAIVLRCLEKDRTRRYSNVGELATALLEYAPERSRISVERVIHLTAMQPATAETVPGKRPRRSSAPEIRPFTPRPRLLTRHVETHSGWGQTARGGKQRSRRGASLFVATALVGFGAVGAWRFHWLSGSASTNSTATSSMTMVDAPPAPAPPPVKAHAPERPPPTPAERPPTPDTSPPTAASSVATTAAAPVRPLANAAGRTKATGQPQAPRQNAEPGGGSWEEQRK